MDRNHESESFDEPIQHTGVSTVLLDLENGRMMYVVQQMQQLALYSCPRGPQ